MKIQELSIIDSQDIIGNEISALQKFILCYKRKGSLTNKLYITLKESCNVLWEITRPPLVLQPKEQEDILMEMMLDPDGHKWNGNAKERGGVVQHHIPTGETA